MVQATRIPVADIFVTSGFPDFTFVAPVVYPRLVNALRQRAGGVVVEGPSGIGKSVAVRRAIEEIGDGLGPVTALSARDSTQRAAIKRVAEEKPDGTWVIEDFHQLPIRDRTALADAIKFLADQRDPQCKIVLVGINNAGQSLLHGSSSDLLTRITVVQFERNPTRALRSSFALESSGSTSASLNKGEIIQEARGSFLLAQLVWSLSRSS